MERIKQFKKIMRCLLGTEENPVKSEIATEQPVEIKKFQSFDEIVLEFHQECGDFSSRIRYLRKIQFALVMIMIYSISFFFIDNALSGVFGFSFFESPLIRFFLLLSLSVLSVFFIDKMNVYIDEEIIKELKDREWAKIFFDNNKIVDNKTIIDEVKNSWIYSKFGTKQLNSINSQFSNYKTKLLILENFMSFFKMLGNIKFIELSTIGLITYLVNSLSNTVLSEVSLDVNQITQLIIIVILIYSSYVFLKIHVLVFNAIIDLSKANNEISEVRRQKFLEALESANKFEVSK